MRKYAFLLMGEEYTPARHQAKFETDVITSHIFTVNSPQEAKTLVKKLYEEGFGAIEVCGAFGPELTKELIEISNNEIAFGYSVGFDSQKELSHKFWTGA